MKPTQLLLFASAIAVFTGDVYAQSATQTPTSNQDTAPLNPSDPLYGYTPEQRRQMRMNQSLINQQNESTTGSPDLTTGAGSTTGTGTTDATGTNTATGTASDDDGTTTNDPVRR